MAFVPEADTWEAGIYQFEETDVLQGGPAGIDNVPSKQLANRTLHLKNLVDGLGTGKQPLDATLTALAALVTAANKLIYATGADTFATTDLTAFARTLLDDADASAARTTLGAASPADITAAINALVSAAPGTLDTLNELAAALGDDPNFAATITAALGGKQPLDATLTALAALVTAADKLIYATGADTFATTTLSAFSRTLLDDADAAAARATLGITGAAAIWGGYKKIVGSASGTSAVVNYTIDELTTGDGAGNNKTLAAWAGSITMTALGTNGLDVGAVAASTWYYAYGISKPDGTKAFIASLSDTGPSFANAAGYTAWARIGSFLTDGTGNKYPLAFKQKDRRHTYVVGAGTNVPASRLAASGVAGSPSTPTWVAVGLGGYVPATAVAVYGSLSIPAGSANSLMAAPNNAYGAITSANCPPIGCLGLNSGNSVPFCFQLESANIYWASAGSNGALAINGWEDQL